MTTRRNFLKRSSASAALLSLAPAVPTFLLNTSLHAAAQAKKGENILVVVQLSGGNDGLNTVIPYGDDAYARNRFTLRIPDGQVHKIDDHIGLHPSMKGIADLVEASQCSIVQGVGYPNPDRSHFSSMDIWHTGMRDVQAMRRLTGWVGRYLDKYLAREGREVPALHLGQERQPLAVVAEDVRVPSISSGQSFKLNVGNDHMLGQIIESSVKANRASTKDNELLGFLQTSMSSALLSSQRLQDALKNYKTSVQYPNTGLATKMKTIAQLIDGGLSTRIYYVTLGGFDTHATQAPTHAAQLKEFSDAVAAFTADMAEHSHDKRVLVMAFSEFGRRVKENASRGTDHGTAAPMFLAGAKVKPGLIGKHPSLTDLDAEGDMIHHTDFRQVYAAVLNSWLGADSKAVLGEAYKPAPVLKV